MITRRELILVNEFIGFFDFDRIQQQKFELQIKNRLCITEDSNSDINLLRACATKNGSKFVHKFCCFRVNVYFFSFISFHLMIKLVYFKQP